MSKTTGFLSRDFVIFLCVLTHVRVFCSHPQVNRRISRLCGISADVSIADITCALTQLTKITVGCMS